MGVPTVSLASGYSGIKAALRCPSATRLAHKPLNASLRSFVHDCKGEVKLLIHCAMHGEYPLRNSSSLHDKNLPTPRMLIWSDF